MAFQIKDFASIAASSINWMKTATKKVTDFNIGSVVRTMIEAIAAEIDELYQQMFIGLKEAIPVSVYNSFDFTAIEAVPAGGLIRVVVTSSASSVLISAGTNFTTVGKQVTYTSTEDKTIAAGNTFVDVPVVATTSGLVGNIAAGAAFTPSPTPSNYVSASNPTAFINGVDQETDDQRKLRFNDYIASLNRGTVKALDYGLKTTVLYDALGNEIERVVLTSIVEPWLTDSAQPISLVNCYIHNGSGGTSSALVLRAKEVLYGYYDALGNAVPGWKAAGVKVEVFAASELSLSVAGALTPVAGYSEPALLTAAATAASEYIKGLGIGVKFQVASLIDAVMSIEGVANFVPADHAPPALPVLGSTPGGALGARTYYVVATYLTPSGETLVSAEASLAVPANSVLTVASPASKPGLTGWNVYVGTASGANTKQNAALIAIGTGYTEPTSGLIAGAAKPTVSTARLEDISVTASQKLMPGTITIT